MERLSAGRHRRCGVVACSLAGLTLVLSACTSFRPAAGGSEDQRDRILAGELVAPGDRVRLTTADGQTHDFRVQTVDVERGALSGRRESVEIAAITALETRELSWIKTGVLIGVLAHTLFGLRLRG